jgi:putative ABC transport system ATP-binding protein
VKENIAFPLLLNGAKDAEAMSRADDLIEKVGLTSRADAGAEELSGGEMQRCAIARALAPRPRLLLADEPTGNLDSTTGEQILDLLEAVTEAEGMSLVMVTHSDAATRICHRVVNLLDGRIQDSVSA